MAGDHDERTAAAIDELYALDPADFTERRNALAAAARKAGAAEQAKQIAALRRPTRAAWILNQLARSHPDLADEFAELGQQLRTAHTSLDGTQLRELTKQRRQLIDQTAAQAFSSAGIDAPAAALRDDVMATLGAVLSDGGAAQRFASATLVTAEDQSGFGPIGAQLTALPTRRDEQDVAPVGSGATKTSPRASRQESRRQAAITKAELDVENAQEAKEAADEASDQAAVTVRQLNDQLADAKRREDDARLDARHAEVELRKAQQALVRAQQAR